MGEALDKAAVLLGIAKTEGESGGMAVDRLASEVESARTKTKHAGLSDLFSELSSDEGLVKEVEECLQRACEFPRPMVDQINCDFSFSGLKVSACLCRWEPFHLTTLLLLSPLVCRLSFSLPSAQAKNARTCAKTAQGTHNKHTTLTNFHRTCTVPPPPLCAEAAENQPQSPAAQLWSRQHLNRALEPPAEGACVCFPVCLF